MSSRRSRAEDIIQTFLGRANKSTDFTAETSLFADGLGLDSLETAELSAMLEDEISEDPFSQGLTPETVGELLAFYDDDVAAVS